jgi:DNA adenine methylase
MPPHLWYHEPYFGGGGVLLNKPPSSIESANDLSSRVVTFFRVLRDYPEEFIRAITLTPYAEEEHVAARALPVHLPAGSKEYDLELARRFYVLSWQGRGGATVQWNTGWRFQRSRTRTVTISEQWSSIDHLQEVATRLKYVQFSCRPALESIARFDNADCLHLCDPPYVKSTRSKWKDRAYDHDAMGEDEHRELSEVLHNAQGMVLLCGYRCALYDTLYKGWVRHDRAVLTDAGQARTESLWLNPAASERARQPALFAHDQHDDDENEEEGEKGNV